ncbi:MAG: glutamate synthase [Desulfuromonas sp.]|uniref:Tll0287-like domain-containing protein n=1 Tax=Desulfuromonas sp. TaxID=892 RepID=UPI000CA67335|nr:DUF3365 domain-containing protein [Desulfuromonas sp.]PLX81684.1 MAG: glutamate synthase [Desulfuromonas sp.]
MLRISGFLMVCILAVWVSSPAASGGEGRVEPCREATRQFASTLKGELVGALRQGGPVFALGVCRDRAPAIAGAVSAERGLRIGRTALKVRNRQNAPDPWERAVLESFEERKAGGEALPVLERYEVVEEEGGRVLRYMKAIPTGEVCLVCHGTAVAPDVRAGLRTLYPEDRATGFGAGDIRGAFTVSMPLD